MGPGPAQQLVADAGDERDAEDATREQPEPSRLPDEREHDDGQQDHDQPHQVAEQTGSRHSCLGLISSILVDSRRWA